MPQATTYKALAVLLPGLACACTYDLDKIYENESDAAGADAGSEPLPNPLIGLWEGQSEACASCARSECGATNDTCRADPECSRLTRCAARGADPSTLDDCRSDQVSWLAEDPAARTLGGPYYSCVFRDQCADQCATRSDLACLGEYGWTRATTTSVEATFQFVDALMPEQRASGLDVKVCRGEDLDCVAPTATASTDADGKVALSLPAPQGRYTGYLELMGGDWYPTIVQLGYPVARPAALYMPIVDEASIAFNIQLSGVQPDPARGQLQMRMFGCSGVGTRGVTFEANEAFVDAMTRTWYATPLPSFTITSTRDLGSGGIINVKPGSVEIIARLEADGSVVARARAPVRAGYLTIVVLAPLDAAQ
jgi:hypothetical protein